MASQRRWTDACRRLIKLMGSSPFGGSCPRIQQASESCHVNSKCRYSKRGCKRCKDPDFQARQLAKANKAQPGASEQHKRAIKRRRNRTVGRPETETPPAAKRSRKRAHSVSHNPTPKEIVGVDETVELHAETRAADTAEQLSNSPAKKRIGSGLELGLAAGLLSLPVTDAAEQQSLEDGTLEQRGQRPPATSLPTSTAPGTASDISCSSTQATGAAAEQSSRGQDANGSVGRKEGPEEQKQRQRNFMDLLHSKIRQKHEQRQQQQQQGATNDGPSLAAALALGARRKKVKEVAEFKGDPRVSLWEPPQSPFGLIEEQLFGNPWKLLVACILLNKTSVVQVRKVIWRLFELMPTPEEAMHADVEAVRELIEPLGLAPKRAPMLIRFSKEYVEKQWTNPVELHGVGQYAADAYNIFCRGDWRSVSPKDKDLLRYHQWLTETGGEGSGLTRDAVPASGGAGNISDASVEGLL